MFKAGQKIWIFWLYITLPDTKHDSVQPLPETKHEQTKTSYLEGRSKMLNHLQKQHMRTHEKLITF